MPSHDPRAAIPLPEMLDSVLPQKYSRPLQPDEIDDPRTQLLRRRCREDQIPDPTVSQCGAMGVATCLRDLDFIFCSALPAQWSRYLLLILCNENREPFRRRSVKGRYQDKYQLLVRLVSATL